MKRSATASSTTAIATSSRSARLRSGRIDLRSGSSRERCKALRHGPIHLAPERYHEIGDAIEPLPSPPIELRWLAVARRQRIDFVIAPNKTQREPFLPLAAESGETVR